MQPKRWYTVGRWKRWFPRRECSLTWLRNCWPIARGNSNPHSLIKLRTWYSMSRRMDISRDLATRIARIFWLSSLFTLTSRYHPTRTRWRHHADQMAQRRDLARPMMGARTSLHTHQAGGCPRYASNVVKGARVNVASIIIVVRGLLAYDHKVLLSHHQIKDAAHGKVLQSSSSHDMAPPCSSRN